MRICVQAGGVFYAAVWRVFWSASVSGVIYMCLQGRGGECDRTAAS